jgi:hypothetical protein
VSKRFVIPDEHGIQLNHEQSGWEDEPSQDMNCDAFVDVVNVRQRPDCQSLGGHRQKSISQRILRSATSELGTDTDRDPINVHLSLRWP